jgi:hypothetical protein
VELVVELVIQTEEVEQVVTELHFLEEQQLH